VFAKYFARYVFAPKTPTPQIALRLMAEADVFVVGLDRSSNGIVVRHEPDPELGYKLSDSQRAQPIHNKIPPKGGQGKQEILNTRERTHRACAWQ
jgi:hypothetical protein